MLGARKLRSASHIPARWKCLEIGTGSPLHREDRERGPYKEIPLREKPGNFEICQKNVELYLLKW